MNNQFYEDVKKPFVSYYDILQCSRHATKKKIQDNYKRLVMEIHPDKARSIQDSPFDIVTVNEAYQVLSDDNERTRYDSYLASGLLMPYDKWKSLALSSNECFHWTANLTDRNMLTGPNVDPMADPDQILSKFRNYDI